MFLGRETLEDHSQLPKKANKCSVWGLQAFRMYGGIGMSASSLHRESTDSLIDIPACESVHMKTTINHSVDLELFINIGWRKKGHEMSRICRIKMETHAVHARMGNHLSSYNMK